LDEKLDPARDAFAADTLRPGRVVQEMGLVSIVEVIRHHRYGRTTLEGYFVRGGPGDPDLLHPTIVSAEAELLRRNWNLLIRKKR